MSFNHLASRSHCAALGGAITSFGLRKGRNAARRLHGRLLLDAGFLLSPDRPCGGAVCVRDVRDPSVAVSLRSNVRDTAGLKTCVLFFFPPFVCTELDVENICISYTCKCQNRWSEWI